MALPQGAVSPGQCVVVDDLLASGDTTAAGIALLLSVSAEVPTAAARDRTHLLGGRARLDVPTEALTAYQE